ncbi:MAG: nucleoside triphosphate pyrophosphohydrolase [Alphaproteobacteria bacterium]|nr:nucleoside triphosphate pyrophosphohydrolase [Alphaproteobacteria bacterium]
MSQNQVYRKLVRDRIPEIIAGRGECPQTRVLSDDDFKAALVRKLDEEVAEFKTDRNLEELADILEVVDALAGTLNGTFADVLKIKRAKRSQRGGFEKKLFLEQVAARQRG